MRFVILVAILWFLGSIVIAIGYWIYALFATLNFHRNQNRHQHEATGLIANKKQKFHEILLEKDHPLYPYAKSVQLGQLGFTKAWFSGLMAGLALFLLRHQLHT